MPFNDVIIWPREIDSFPSLRDNTTPAVDETEVLYAEHYRKLRNSIRTMQMAWTGTTIASGDGTVQGIAMPNVLFVDIWSLFQLMAPNHAQYSQPNSDQIFPGNVLPFEFIWTYSSDNYESWMINGYYLAFQPPPDKTTFQNLANGGLDMITYPPMASAGVVHPTLLTGPNAGLIVSYQVMQDTETLAVRGVLIDTDWDSPTYLLNHRWLQYQGHYLYCAIQGLKTNG